MATMHRPRAVLRSVWDRRSTPAGGGPAPVYWGRIGGYEAVTRDGVLLLLSPDPRHPSLRAGARHLPGKA